MNDLTLPGLIVPVEARIDKLEKALKRANQAQGRAAGAMEKRAKQSADRMAKSYEEAGGRMSAVFKKFITPKLAGIAGTAVGIGIGGSVAAVRSTVAGIAEIGDAAKRAGMQAEAFQEWKFVAEQNRIGVDALTDGFKELSLRADEFVTTGSGSAAEAFERLGFSAEELKTKLADPSKLMVEIIKRMEGLDKAAQIRISDELFGGTGGEQFVQLLDKGAEGIQAQIDRARDLGLVIDSDMIGKAAALDAKFAEVEARLRSVWRTGVVEAAQFFGMIDRELPKLTFDPDTVARLFGQGTADALGALPEVPADALAQIEALATEYADLADEARQLVPALSDASTMLRGVGDEAGASTLTDLATRIGEAARAFDAGTITGEEYAEALRDVVAEAEASLTAMSDLDQARLAGVIAQVQSLLEWIRLIPGAAAAARAEINSLSLMDTGTPLTDDGNLLPPSPNAPRTSPRPKEAPAMLGEPELPKPARGGKGGGQDDFAAAVEGLQREIAALDAEAISLLAAAQAGEEYADALEFARTRAELLTAAQTAGKTITPELTAEIDRLAEAHTRAGAAAAKAADDLAAVEERGKAGAEALTGIFTSVLTGAKTAEEALAGLLLAIAEAQLQKLFMNMFTGSGASTALGGLLGFASGGYTGAGGKHQPAGIVHRGEYVMSADATRRIGPVNLEALHRAAQRGYAAGGLVGIAPTLTKPAMGVPARSGEVAQSITISAPITVNGSAGTPAQNDDLAKKMSKELKDVVRVSIAEELRRQMRPGNQLAR